MHCKARNNALVFISSPFFFPLHGEPHDFQRFTKFYYQNVFKNDEIITIRESNSSLSTAITMINLALEVSPLSSFTGVKHFIYTFTNIFGIASDQIVRLLLRLTGKRFERQFYSMPLGYALVVRIRK
jgi:hypothetical protein